MGVPEVPTPGEERVHLEIPTQLRTALGRAPPARSAVFT